MELKNGCVAVRHTPMSTYSTAVSRRLAPQAHITPAAVAARHTSVNPRRRLVKRPSRSASAASPGCTTIGSVSARNDTTPIWLLEKPLYSSSTVKKAHMVAYPPQNRPCIRA